MFETLLYAHSLIRWLVLASLICALYLSFKGYVNKEPFGKMVNAVRHWTATIAHLQLVLGIIIYSQSPVVKYFWGNSSETIHDINSLFYGLIHIALMIIAIVCITIGSALSKRKNQDSDKYKTMLLWFIVALFIIFIAIPWPFSPLASRPYFR